MTAKCSMNSSSEYFNVKSMVKMEGNDKKEVSPSSKLAPYRAMGKSSGRVRGFLPYTFTILCGQR